MADKCTKCSESIVAVKDPVRCAECSGYFHPECCRLKTADAWRKLGAKKSSWRCDPCRTENASSQSDTSDNTTILATLQAMRKDIADNQVEARKRFDDIEKQINSFQQSIEENKVAINTLREENTKLRELCNLSRVQSESNVKEIRELRLEVLELQQYSRRHNLEIKGLPKTQGENVYYIMELISKALNIPWSRGDISVAHRLPQPDSGHPTIIAAFVSRSTREAWVSAARQRKLRGSDISPHLGPEPVYINSHLTRHNKQLLGRAKQLVRDGKLAAAWTTEGKVLIRKTAGEAACRIYMLDDLKSVG